MDETSMGEMDVKLMSVTKVDAPRAIAIGEPIASSIKNIPNSTATLTTLLL
jgi:hypothetical protein